MTVTNPRRRIDGTVTSTRTGAPYGRPTDEGRPVVAYSETTMQSPAQGRSPFPGGVRMLEPNEAGHEAPAAAWLSTPFAEGLSGVDGAAEDESALAALAAELEDEEFGEAVQGLVDEAAGRHLTSVAQWSSESEAPALATGEVEAWLSGLATEADRLLEQLEFRFAERGADSLQEGEVEAAVAEALAGHGGSMPAEEQFLGAIIRKAGKLAKGVASVVKRGLATVGKLLPLGRLFGLLRKLVAPLLRRVLTVARGRLPANLRPAADLLARKLGAGEAEDEGPVPALVSSFDASLGALALAGNEAAVGEVLSEAEAEAAGEAEDRLGALDTARAGLAAAIARAAPGEVLTAEVEQFIPAVMAAMPLIKAGVGLLGRDKLVRFLAGRLAGLIRPHVGPEAGDALSRAIADLGLRGLSLETEAPATLGAEAMVSMLEDTVRAVGELPAESLAEPLRLEAEVQEAFAEAAARHVPAQLLRGDLGMREAEDGQGGVWILMPRSTRRSYRYRKYSRVCPVTLTRPLARAVVLRDGDSLERRLLDVGVGRGRWPPRSISTRRCPARSWATWPPSSSKPRAGRAGPPPGNSRS